MADKTSDEVIAQLADLQRRTKELFAEHNRVNQELLDVLQKINSPTGVAADGMEHGASAGREAPARGG
jgi:hypothetical protein